jgi:hypothetical protein
MGWQFLIKMGLFGKLLSTALDVIETPIAIVKDVATLGGTLTDETKPYTQQKLEELGDDYEDFKDELRKK